MKERIMKFVKVAANYILKPIAVVVSFSFALGRAYERVNALNRGGYGYAYNK